MKKRKAGGDASFLIGLVLGLAIGAAVAMILSESTQDTFPRFNKAVDEARETLESKAGEAKARLEGAAEGATPA